MGARAGRRCGRWGGHSGRTEDCLDASITLAGDDAALRKPLEQAAQLLAGGGKGDIEPDLLASRARTDVERLRAALYEVGHYAGEIAVTIVGQPLPAPGSPLPATVPGERLAVQYDVNPGPLFQFGAIRVDVGEAQPASGIPDLVTLGLVEGAPVSSKVLVRAIDKLIEAWRQAGHPLVRPGGKDIRADGYQCQRHREERWRIRRRSLGRREQLLPQEPGHQVLAKRWQFVA